MISNIISSQKDDTNSHLFPPDSVAEFNMTGPLNSFVEQIQANSRSQEIQVPVVQMPANSQGRGSVFYYGENEMVPVETISAGQQPVFAGPQNRPSLDPALQQLLNSFNTNQAEAQAQRNTFIQSGSNSNMPPTIVSYITCYVGCSHVTNIVANSAAGLVPSFFTVLVPILLLLLIWII